MSPRLYDWSLLADVLRHGDTAALVLLDELAQSDGVWRDALLLARPEAAEEDVE